MRKRNESLFINVNENDTSSEIINIGATKEIKSSGCSEVGSEPRIGIAGSEFKSIVNGEIRVSVPRENPMPKKYEMPAIAIFGR